MSVPSTPLLGCAPTGAVVMSVSNISRVTGVDVVTLVEALRHQTEDGEKVDITETSDDIVIGEEGAPQLCEFTMARKGRVLNGSRRDDTNESSALLSRSASSTKSLSALPPTPIQTPLSVRIRALHDPTDSLYLIPRIDEVSSCVIVPDSLDHRTPWLPRLPSTVKEVKDIGISEGAYYLVIEYARPAIVWMLLMCSVAALASKAIVARDMYPGNISPLLKSVWMTSFTLFAFSILAFIEIASDPKAVGKQIRELFNSQPASHLRYYIFGGDLIEVNDHCRLSSFTLEKDRQPAFIRNFSAKMLLLTGILHGMFGISFLVSLENTSLAKCVVLMNLHPIMILGSTLSDSRVTERVGAIVVLIGILLLYKSSESSGSEPQNSSLFGDFMGFMVSIYMWLYLSLTQKLQQELPGMTLMAAVNGISVCVQVTFCIAVGINFFDALDVANQFWFPNSIGGIVGGAVSYGGFLIASRYLSPLVISVNITLEPLYAVCLNIAAGGASPEFSTWSALCVIAVGAAAVAIGGGNHSDNKQIMIPTHEINT